MRSHRLVLALAAALAISPVHEPAAAAAQAYEDNQPSGPERFSGTELIAAGHLFFAAKELAMTVQEAVRRWGEPERDEHETLLDVYMRAMGRGA